MSSTEKETPLMRQYNQIKRKHPETILLFRLGDFFETFGDDAVITARVCGITLTKRNNGAAGEMPLAGFPHHQLDNYLPKLVRAGYRVAVCEQMEDPKLARGIVKRDVVEVVTPGVAMYDRMLEAGSNTYVAAVCFMEKKGAQRVAGVSFADVSTGEFNTCEVPADELRSLLETISPAEILIPKSLVAELQPLCEKLPNKPALTRLEEWIFEHSFASELLVRHLKTQSLKGFGVEEYTVGITAAGAVLHYISETQQGKISHMKSLRNYNASEYMVLDFSTRRNLELIFSMGAAQSSLVSVLDDTCTAMGARMIKMWMLRPLLSKQRIELRLAAVETLFTHQDVRNNLRGVLSTISDVERLVSKVCTMRASTRDMISLKKSLAAIPLLKSIVDVLGQSSLKQAVESLNELRNVVELLENALVDEPSLVFGSGAIFKDGYSAELDEIREAMYSGKNWVSSYQESLREQTGIPSLKVGFNNVFGYYIEISNAHKGKAPESFVRKQTMTNAERYITPELKEIESKILNAEESITGLEQKLFNDIRAGVAEFTEQIQHNAQLLATIDCLQSFAHVSALNNYTQPTIVENGELHIVEGRHPVVEKLLPVGERYVPNHTTLAPTTEQIHIITGPNMAGKSCYLRQVGLITLLAHIGCFVPAQQATVPLTDRIFTRVGAQDNIAAGESTFLVEMQEAANILHNATERSLILLDEVGRGTATFDGISIAWAIVEHLHEHVAAKTLFATHYHELNDLEQLFPRICNYYVQVQEVANTIIFTRKVERGSTDHSFGIHVAQMAGLPQSVTQRAKEILQTLEANNENLVGGTNATTTSSPTTKKALTHSIESTHTNNQTQLSMFELRDDALRAKLREIDVHNITPIQALQVLSELKREV